LIEKKSVLAVILARGGSKRLINKNILNLAGKPLIQWTIEAGLNSKYIDELIVSSDNKKILEISKEIGAKIQQRPIELSDDQTTSYQSIEYVINSIEKNYDYVILLQPTSPFRNEKHIDQSLELLISKKADGIISVCKSKYDKSIIITLPKNGDMSNFYENIHSNNKVEDYYQLNGAIYICKTEVLLNEKTFFIKNNIFAYKMKNCESIDIDTKHDLEFANYLAKSK